MKKFLLLLTITLTSCSSPYFHQEPLAENDTLVLGTITLDRVNNDSMHSIGTGIYQWGIELHIKEISTNQKTIVHSKDDDGFFYFTNLNPGLYKISRLYYKNAKGRYIGITPQQKNIFTVKPGKIHNLGELIWYSNTDNDESTYIFFKNHDKVREAFAMRYPKSKWLAREWVQTRY